jgi:hypothetical protein
MSNKVVIRLINPKSSEAEAARPPEVVVYHWRRILAALGLTAAVSGGIMWGINGWTAKDQPALPVETPLPTASKALTPLPQTLGRSAADPSPATDSAVTPPASPPAEAIPAAAPSSDPVRALHRKMKRIQLSSHISGEEPVDRLGPTITLQNRKPMRLYLFMEVVGLKGKTLYQDWYWKDKRLQHAKFAVTHDRFSAASGKLINGQLTGPWQVRVVDENGKAFAEGAFEVR